MPKISNRALRTPASPIRKLVPYAEAAKKRGIKVHHLNIGQPDIVTPSHALEVLKQANLKIVEYTHSAGTESYRRRLAEFYNGYDMPLNHEQIIVTNGGSEALLFAMIACLDAGDELIIPEPFYANYNGFAESLDVKILPVGSTIDQNFALPSIADFEKVITPRTKAIMICNPGNPTGYLYTEAELFQLAALVKKYDIYLIADEVYRDFCYDNTKHFSILCPQFGLQAHAVVLDSISKRYSACGARIGMFMTQNPELYSAAMRLAQARLSPSVFSQILGEALVDTPKSYFEGVNTEYALRRKTVIDRLSKMKGVKCPNPQGAFYMLVELPIDDSDKFAQWMLEHFQYNNQTVMFAPATGFYSRPELGKKQVRIAYVLNVEELNQAMDCLEQGLISYQLVMNS